MTKINTAWKNTSLTMKKLAKHGETLTLAYKTNPRESVLWSFVFVSSLAILSLLITSRIDLIVELSGELYQALPKVFK